ncbi:MAG: FtsX-like permease family protein [Candidatus Hatepunaea meridiana]|nr:FtsX-like permease family protein [Candidatus Hatepunaea meridiana]
MNMLKLAFRNTRRQPRRTLLTALAIGITVAAVTYMDAHIKGITTGIFKTFVKLEAGHVKVVPREAVDRSRPLPLDKGIKDITSLISVIRSSPGIINVSPRISFPVLLDKGSNSIPAFGIGLLPSQEADLMNLEEMIVTGRLLSDSSWDVMLGNKLADKLDLDVGDELFMVTTDSYGGLGPGLYNVCGIVSSGVSYIDKRTFYVSLYAAQEQLSMVNSAMEIVCSVENGLEGAIPVADSLSLLLQLADRDDVAPLPWQMQGSLYSALAPAKVMYFLIMLLLGIIALTTVVNTVLMSVMERTREIGALRALGFKRGTVISMIMSESLVIGFFATICGIIFGMTVALILHETGIDLSGALESTEFPMKPIVYPDPSILTAVKAAFFGLILSLAAAWYPARVAVRMEPAQALRSE